MKPVHCAAVDLGATSGRVLLGAWDGRRLRLREVHRFPVAFGSLAGHDYWDVGTLWQQVQAGLSAAVSALPAGAKLASVGVDTWGVDHVLLGERGRLMFPVHAYRDPRTRPGLDALAGDRRQLARLYAATGIPNIFYNTSLQLAEALTCCPHLRRGVRRCLLLPDYFNFLLSGRMENEVSIASTTQLLGVGSEPGWSAAALRHFGVPASWFSPPIHGQTRLGRNAQAAAPSGAEIIAVPGHDTACAYDAMPAAADGRDLYISSGTWSLVGFESDTPVLGAGALAAGISNERTGCGRYRPLMHVPGLWLIECVLKEFSARPATPSAWESLIAAAAAGPRPPVLLDPGDPGLDHPASMRRAIDRQLRRHRAAPPTHVAGYMRLVCASIGRGHADALRQFELLAGRTFSRILMVGGGARNRLLCQATADAAGRPVIAFDLEGAATGNLVRQLLALHAVKDLAAVRAQLAPAIPARTYNPSY